MGIEIYFLVLFFLSLAVMGYSIPFKNFKDIKNLKALFFLVLFLVPLRFFLIEHQSLWLDEFTQIELSKNNNPVWACAQQSQPPISCLITRVSLNIGGDTSVIILRTPIVILSILGSLFLFGVLFQILKDVSLSVLIVLIFNLHPVWTQFSYEIRPMALGILGLLIWLSQVIRIYEKKVVQSFDFLILVAAALFFLNSIGFQSVLVLFSILISLSLLSKGQKNLILKMGLAHLLAFLLYFPIWYESIKFARQENILRLVNFDQSFLSLFNNLKWSFWHGWGVFGPIVILMTYFLIKKSNIYFKTFYLSSFVFLSLMGLSFTFLINRNVDQSSHYALSGWVLMLLAIAIYFKDFWESPVNKNNKRLGLIFVFLLAFSWWFFEKPKPRYNYAEVLSPLKYKIGPHDHVVNFCLVKEQHQCHSFYRENTFLFYYLKTREKRFEVSNQLSAIQIWQHFKSQNQNPTLYLVLEAEQMPLNSQWKDLIRKLQPELSLIVDDYSALLEVKGDLEDQFKVWKKFIDYLVQTSPSVAPYLELKMQIELLEKNYDEALKTFAQWEKLDSFTARRDSRRAFYQKELNLN